MNFSMAKRFRSLGLVRRKKSTQLYPIEIADFEAAIVSTGYGRFNYLLLLVSAPCCLTSVFATTTISYILPSAQCDLDLELVDKGALNAITYAGMITSAIFWGYISDVLGRKKLLVFGYLINAVCEVTCALSQRYWFLMLFKFLGGAIINGPFAVFLAYVSEFHGQKQRSRIMLSIGVFFSLANILLPLLGMAILTQTINITIFPDFITLHSWQIFLLVCSIPSWVSGIILIFLPESPKFLMSRGRNDEALEVLQTVFKINSGRPKYEYPVKSLINELEEETDTTEENSNKTKGVSSSGVNVNYKGLKALTNGFSQLAPMFKKPLLGRCILTFTIQFGLLLGTNTLRLWMPQIFAGYSMFEELTKQKSVPLCHIVENYLAKKDSVPVFRVDSQGNCISVFSGETYMNSIYMGLVTFIGYFVAEGMVLAVGNRIILIGGIFICGSVCIGLYFANNLLITIVLSSIFVTLGSISSTSLIGIAINSAPTTNRTIMIALTMMCGRVGSIIGNMVFPVLIPYGCLMPFLILGVLMYAIGILCFFLENTYEAPLQ